MLFERFTGHLENYKDIDDNQTHGHRYYQPPLAHKRAQYDTTFFDNHFNYGILSTGLRSANTKGRSYSRGIKINTQWIVLKDGPRQPRLVQHHPLSFKRL